MMGSWMVAAALGAFGLLAVAGSDVPIETVAAGEQSGVGDPRQVVARAQEEWGRLWQEHAPRLPIPKVDFGVRMVVGVFLGTRPTSGFAVRVTRARLEEQGHSASARNHAVEGHRTVRCFCRLRHRASVSHVAVVNRTGELPA